MNTPSVPFPATRAKFAVPPAAIVTPVAAISIANGTDDVCRGAVLGVIAKMMLPPTVGVPGFAAFSDPPAAPARVCGGERVTGEGTAAVITVADPAGGVFLIFPKR
jgi:hypothetical protein